MQFKTTCKNYYIIVIAYERIETQCEGSVLKVLLKRTILEWTIQQNIDIINNNQKQFGLVGGFMPI